VTPRITEERWAPIDEELFAHRVLQALLLTQQATGCGLKEAIELVHQR
jgi:hypothetical protein